MANKMRMIDANTLKWRLGQVTLYVPWLRFGKTAISKILESYRRAVFEEIDNAPTVDAVEVVHGYWIYSREPDDDLNVQAHCSVCGAGDNHAVCMIGHVPYCWHCGAKMDLEAPHD